MKTLLLGCMLLCLCSCNKTVDARLKKAMAPHTKSTTPADFTLYTIKGGQHHAAGNVYKLVELTALRFAVRFDSTAIYQTEAAINQYDINKLYGFSDNNSGHHQYSARVGWNWSDGALRLYAYVYNQGKREEKEISAIDIGKEIHCSIDVTADTYIFKVGNVMQTMPRSSITPAAKGYLLYPYFGGDEAAPHDMHVWIKNL